MGRGGGAEGMEVMIEELREQLGRVLGKMKEQGKIIRGGMERKGKDAGEVKKQSRMLKEEVKLFKGELDLKNTTRRMEIKAIFYKVSEPEIQENGKEDSEDIEKTIRNMCGWRDED